MYSLEQWQRISIRPGIDAHPSSSDFDRTRQIERKAGNDILTEEELSVIRELLKDALYDLDVVNETISLFHIIRNLLIQTIRRSDRVDILGSVTQNMQHTPGGLLIPWYTRTERVARLRAALAPHKKLPPELLVKIFVEACNDQPYSLPPRHRNPRHAITLVCTRWRQIAFNEPSLWNNLFITTRYSLGQNFADRMREIFSRNAGLPISLKIDGDGYYDEPLVRTPITDIVVPHLSVFRTLDLRFPTACLSSFLHSPPGFVDSLESLRLDMQPGYGRWEYHSAFAGSFKPITIFLRARRLRIVEIESAFNHGSWIHLDPGILHLPWAQLTRFRLGPAVAVTPDQAHYVLRQATRLINCRLDLTSSWGYHNLDDDDVPPVVCPDLESLYLFILNDAHLAQFLQPLVLASLKDFTCTTEGYSCEQTELTYLIRRSECSINSIKMSSRRTEVADTTLLEELPCLMKLEAFSLTFTGMVFGEMSRRQLLPNLDIFYSRTDCPGLFVDMLEERETSISVGERKTPRRPRVARVGCNASVSQSAYDDALERLRKLERVEAEYYTMWKADYDTV